AAPPWFSFDPPPDRSRPLTRRNRRVLFRSGSDAAETGDAMLTRAAFAALLLAAAGSNALAAQANIGGVFIQLPPPGAVCELSESNESDKRMITLLGGLLEKSGNKLLAMSADCRQLSDWHSGKRQLLDDYAQYQTAIAGMDKPPSETVAQTCNTLRQEGN